MSKGSNRPREFADPHLLGGGRKTTSMPLNFVPPDCQLQAECDRLRMDPMGSANLNSMFMLIRTFLKGIRQFCQTVGDERRCGFNLERLCRIHHVVRSKPVVQPASRLPCPLRLHGLRNRRSKGNHVVTHFSFDGGYALKVNPGMRAKSL